MDAKNKIGAEVFGSAKYIKCDPTPSELSFYDPLPFFRREIVLDSPVESARIYVQSPSFAKFYINGKLITEDIFISPISDYTKILWYNSYDVTELLKEGKNVVGVICGNGFFNEPFDTAWGYNHAYWRDAPQFLLSLEVNGKRVLESDSSWKVSKEVSHITFSHLRSGEYVDMRKYDNSWLGEGYDDSAWQNAIERKDAPMKALHPTDCPPVREVEYFDMVSKTEVEGGLLLDFGETVSGYAEVTVQAERGSEIVLRYAEDIDEKGYPKHNRMDTDHFYPQCPFQTDKLIASGGMDSFKPSFSYHGFRYIFVEGARPEQIISAKACFTHNDVKRKSDFVSGNDILNYIYNAGIRSTYSNLFWCFTDCPTREKLGWTNDSQATAEQALINFDMVPLYEKWFEDVKADMCEDGSLHGTIPTHTWGLDWGPVCDCFLYELPYRIYLYTGRSDMLIDAIPYFERYIDFLDKKIKENYEFILGDWLGKGSSKLIPKEFVREFYMLKALRITAFAYRLSGVPSEKWEKMLSERRAEFLARYIDKDGRCTVAHQTSVAMMIGEGLVENKEALKKQLVEIVDRDNMTNTCGMVGIQYIYDALSESGYPEAAYKIITEGEPGYKTWYDHGATTLWECWDGQDKGSHNHHMFSNVLGWFFKSLLGIAPKEEAPAFEEIELHPCFIKDIGFVKGHTVTVRGRIDAEWKYEDGEFIYTVTLPEGIRATFDEKTLKVGKNVFRIKK